MGRPTPAMVAAFSKQQQQPQQQQTVKRRRPLFVYVLLFLAAIAMLVFVVNEEMLSGDANDGSMLTLPSSATLDSTHQPQHPLQPNHPNSIHKLTQTIIDPLTQNQHHDNKDEEQHGEKHQQIQQQHEQVQHQQQQQQQDEAVSSEELPPPPAPRPHLSYRIQPITFSFLENPPFLSAHETPEANIVRSRCEHLWRAGVSYVRVSPSEVRGLNSPNFADAAFFGQHDCVGIASGAYYAALRKLAGSTTIGSKKTAEASLPSSSPPSSSFSSSSSSSMFPLPISGDELYQRTQLQLYTEHIRRAKQRWVHQRIKGIPQHLAISTAATTIHSQDDENSPPTSSSFLVPTTRRLHKREVTVVVTRANHAHAHIIHKLQPLTRFHVHFMSNAKITARDREVPLRDEAEKSGVAVSESWYNSASLDESVGFLHYIINNYPSANFSLYTAFVHAEQDFHVTEDMSEKLSNFNYGMYPYMTLNEKFYQCERIPSDYFSRPDSPPLFLSLLRHIFPHRYRLP